MYNLEADEVSRAVFRALKRGHGEEDFKPIETEAAWNKPDVQTGEYRRRAAEFRGGRRVLAKRRENRNAVGDGREGRCVVGRGENDVAEEASTES